MKASKSQREQKLERGNESEREDKKREDDNYTVIKEIREQGRESEKEKERKVCHW